MTTYQNLNTPACTFVGNALPRIETPNTYRYAVRHPQGDRTYIVTDQDLTWTSASPQDALTMGTTTPPSNQAPASGTGTGTGTETGANTPSTGVPPSDDIGNLAAGQSILRININIAGAYRYPLPRTPVTVTGPEPGRTKIDSMLSSIMQQQPTSEAPLVINRVLVVPEGNYSITTTRHLNSPNYNNFPEVFIPGNTARFGKNNWDMTSFFMAYTNASGTGNPYTNTTSTETISGNTTRTVTFDLKGRGDAFYYLFNHVGPRRNLLTLENTLNASQNIARHKLLVLAYEPGESYAPTIPTCAGQCWLDPSSGWKIKRETTPSYTYDAYNTSLYASTYTTPLDPAANAPAHLVVATDFEPIDPSAPMRGENGQVINTTDIFKSTTLYGGVSPMINNAYMPSPSEVPMFPALR